MFRRTDSVHIIEGCNHYLVESLQDLLILSVIIVEVLAPFEIAYDDTACVGYDIWYDENAHFGEDSVCTLNCGCIGEFEDDSGLDIPGISLADLVGKGRRNEDLARASQQFISGYVSAPREPATPPVRFLCSMTPGI